MEPPTDKLHHGRVLPPGVHPPNAQQPQESHSTSQASLNALDSQTDQFRTSSGQLEANEVSGYEAGASLNAIQTQGQSSQFQESAKPAIVAHKGKDYQAQ